jgi:hypothetical protein
VPGSAPVPLASGDELPVAVRAPGGHGLHAHGPEQVGDQRFEGGGIHLVQVRLLVASMGGGTVEVERGAMTVPRNMGARLPVVGS